MTDTTDQQFHIIRFAGDSGDGIQLQGLQFTSTAAASGYDLATLPDFPAEIRAPAGTRFGVSAFQIQFGGNRITTPGDTPSVLVALNPAALIVNLVDLLPGTLIVVDLDTFTERHLKRAELTSNPLEDGTLSQFEVLPLSITQLTLAAVASSGLGTKDSVRCKNFWVLGLMLWLFDQPRDQIKLWIKKKFAQQQAIQEANISALDAGHVYAETSEFGERWKQTPVPAEFLEGTSYRTVTGSEALALGLVAAGERADIDLVFCSYPITPASSILHYLSGLQEVGVATFQAEDEMAAICAAIGASYAGKLGVTSSSGPGIALKTEGIGLAVAAELPLLIINSQRSGPSTGMPTKTEQSDLYQAVYGRNADTPIPVIAAASPKDCFEVAMEAAAIALRHMTPVMLLTDAYITNASELWPLPDIVFDGQPLATTKPNGITLDRLFDRDEKTYARPWIYPGQAGHIHRIGGLERDIKTGHISYDPGNHQAMTDMRLAKVNSVADFMPPCKLESGEVGGVAVVTWGSTHGVAHQAVNELLDQGFAVAHLHLRYLNPLPKDLPQLLEQFDRILVVEMNTGQLATMLKAQYLIAVEQLNQVTGQPFSVARIRSTVKSLCDTKPSTFDQKQQVSQ